MNKTQTPTPEPKKHKFTKRLRAILWLIAAIFFAIPVIFFFMPNNAQDAAKPLEQALIKNGAVKTGSSGDPGRGPDNSEPWYDAQFTFAKERKAAEELIYRVASENGYTLTHASPENRGFLGVGDAYVDRWYFDGTSKKSHYFAYTNGNIEVSFALNGDPQHQPNEGSTIIRLSVALPPAGF